MAKKRRRKLGKDKVKSDTVLTNGVSYYEYNVNGDVMVPVDLFKKEERR